MLKVILLIGVLISCYYAVALAQPDPPVLPPALIFSASVAIVMEGSTVTSSLQVKLDLALQKEYVKLTFPSFPPSTYIEEYIDFQTGLVTMIQVVNGESTCTNITGIPFPSFTPTFVADNCEYFGPAVIEGQPAQQWNCPMPISSSSVVNTSLFSRGNRLVAEVISVPASSTGPSIVEFLTINEYLPVHSLPSSVFDLPNACFQSAIRRSVVSGVRPVVDFFNKAKIY